MRRTSETSDQFSAPLPTAFFAIWLVVMLATIGTSQAIAAPEKVGVIYLVDGEDFTEIPRSTGKKKTAMFITANSKLRMRFKGKASDFVVAQESGPIFAVVLPSGQTNELVLYPLKAVKKDREAVIGTGGSIHGESSTGAETVTIDFTKQGDDLYRITPAVPLNSGEYAFGFVGSNEYFCFSVQ